MSGPLWIELGENMRRLRSAAGVSLRQAETLCGRSRGNLSQVENAKTRPGVDLVRWYDQTFAGDGLLLAGYAQARSAGSTPVDRPARASSPETGDAMQVIKSWPAYGEIVAADATIELRWLLCNSGAVRWTGRRLERVGAVGGSRLITGAPLTAIDTTEPGTEVEVVCRVRAPAVRSTAVAYWQMIDGEGKSCFPDDPLLSVLLVVV